MIFFLYLLQWKFQVIFYLLPPAAALFFMRLGSRVIYEVARRSPLKRIVEKNLLSLFPGSDAKALSDKLLQNVSLSIFEVLCTPFFNSSHVEHICEVTGTENLDLALAERKGALLLIMHTGNYELIPTALVTRGYHLTSILKAPPKDPIFKLVNRSRRYKGTQLINVMEGNMYRQALQALDQSRLVCLLIDTGALEGSFEMFPFLGREVPVATGWLTLAQRSGSPVIPVLSKREGEKVKLFIGEPMAVNKNNRQEVMQKVGDHFERFIQSHPEQWLIFLNEHETQRMVEGR
jgi:KDO2-lipid IV(A) lauroyltransferase